MPVMNSVRFDLGPNVFDNLAEETSSAVRIDQIDSSSPSPVKVDLEVIEKHFMSYGFTSAMRKAWSSYMSNIEELVIFEDRSESMLTFGGR